MRGDAEGNTLFVVEPLQQSDDFGGQPALQSAVVLKQGEGVADARVRGVAPLRAARACAPEGQGIDARFDERTGFGTLGGLQRFGGSEA
jgi:hypothetical protein